jgi:thiol-disulfide isomerase/thioredoxin
MQSVYFLVGVLLVWVFILKPLFFSDPPTTDQPKANTSNNKTDEVETNMVEGFQEKSTNRELAKYPEELGQLLVKHNVRYYGATWCPACQMQTQICEEAKLPLDDLFYDVDKHQSDSQAHGVEYLPTWVALDNNKVTSSKSGVMNLDKLLEWLQGISSQPQNQESTSESDLRTLLLEKNVRFYGAEWCGACNMMKKNFEEGNVDIEGIYYDADKYQQEIERHGVQAFPTFVMVGQNGEVVSSKVGVQSLDDLASWASSN